MTNPLWSLDLPAYVWGAALIATAAAALILALLTVRLRAIARASKATADCPVLDAADCPGVSVVVYARDDAWNLPALIRSIYTQDYPGPVEAIVVCDLSGYDTADVDAAGALQPLFPSLRVTYIPADSRNLSRKKLAVTIGVKGARHPYVAMTCGNCSIPSPDWLRRMMTHVAHGRSIVAGAATLRDTEGLPGSHAALRGFDEVWQTARSIRGALAGHPRHATGCNLVYSRALFFDNSGFAASLNLNYGDDNLFVDEIADGTNAAVELSPASIVEVLEGDPARAYRLDRLRRDFTARYLPRGPRMVMGAVSCAWWAWLGASVAAIWLGLPSLMPAVAMLAVALALCIPVMVMWRRAAIALKAPAAACLRVPLLMLWHPFYNLRFRIQGLRHRRDNFTWGKLPQ